MGSNKGWLQLSPCLFFSSLSFYFLCETVKHPFCFAAVLCQFGELWYLCFSWLIGFTISKIKSVSGEVLYWFRAMMGLSHLKIRSWGHWIDCFCSTRLPNTDFPVVGCCHFASPGHTCSNTLISRGTYLSLHSGMSSVIRRRRLATKVIFEYWRLHPIGRNTETLAEIMMPARRMYLQFLTIRGKKFISLSPVKKSQELSMLYYHMRNFCNLIGLEHRYFSFKYLHVMKITKPLRVV